jgi:hypothetical protein
VKTYRFVNRLLIDYGYFAEKGMCPNFGDFIALWIAANDLTEDALRLGIDDAEDVPILQELDS